MADKAETMADQLRDYLAEQLGADWRVNVPVTMRADTWYWMIYLSELGLEYRRHKLREQPSDKRDIGDVASIASWTADVEEWINRLKAVVNAEAIQRSKRKTK